MTIEFSSSTISSIFFIKFSRLYRDLRPRILFSYWLGPTTCLLLSCLHFMKGSVSDVECAIPYSQLRSVQNPITKVC
jgi:hypothetical protein